MIHQGFNVNRDGERRGGGESRVGGAVWRAGWRAVGVKTPIPLGVSGFMVAEIRPYFALIFTTMKIITRSGVS